MIYYLFTVNLIGLLTMKLDKYKAINHRYRISESMLMMLAVVGGSGGIYLGMYMFKHKTKKIKFYLGVPLIMIIQCIILGSTL